MVKQLLRFALLVPALAGLPACTLYVRSDVNKALIGSVHCGSFAWAGSFHGNSALRGTIANPVNENRLRTAIAAHLQGGVQATPANADCLVGYGIGSTTVVDGVWPYDWGWGYYGWGWGGPWPGPYAYTQGIIAVDLYDAKSRQPLWHASVDQSLYGASGADADKRIDAAVAAIFSKYPG